MKCSRGDVILIDHPFSDARGGSKVRPAVVVQSDRRNAVLGETIVVLITKNLRHVSSDDTQLLIDIQTADGRASGLNVNLAVKCGKLFTIDNNLVSRKIGQLSTALMVKLDVCLKSALELT